MIRWIFALCAVLITLALDFVAPFLIVLILGTILIRALGVFGQTLNYNEGHLLFNLDNFSFETHSSRYY